MYARRYSAQDEKNIVRVPDNYAGNAFREEEKEELLCPCEEECQEKQKETPCCDCDKKAASSLLPFFNSKITKDNLT